MQIVKKNWHAFEPHRSAQETSEEDWQLPSRFRSVNFALNTTVTSCYPPWFWLLVLVHATLQVKLHKSFQRHLINFYSVCAKAKNKSYIAVKREDDINSSPGVNRTPNQTLIGIIPWWMTCKTDTCWYFFRRTKKNWKWNHK